MLSTTRIRNNTMLHFPPASKLKDIASSIQNLGHPPAVVGPAVTGAIIVLKYRAARDARFKILKKLKMDLEFLSKEIDENLKRYADEETWKVPKLEKGRVSCLRRGSEKERGQRRKGTGSERDGFCSGHPVSDRGLGTLFTRQVGQSSQVCDVGLEQRHGSRIGSLTMEIAGCRAH